MVLGQGLVEDRNLRVRNSLEKKRGNIEAKGEG